MFPNHGVVLLIGALSCAGAFGAALVLWLIRRHAGGIFDLYVVALERDLMIGLGMGATLAVGVAFAAWVVPALSTTPLTDPPSYTVSRVAGLFFASGIAGACAFVLRRLLWWAGWHPLQDHYKGGLTYG